MIAQKEYSAAAAIGALMLLTMAIAAAAFCLLAAAVVGVGLHGVEVFVSGSWRPAAATFNVLPLLLCTLMAATVTTGLSILIGGLASIALSLEAHRPWVRRADAVIGVWSGAPSIVVGLTCLTALTPFLGFSLGAVICALTAMVLPTFTLSLTSLMKQSLDRRFAESRTLGFTLPQSVRHGLWPDIRRPATALTLITMARAIGEATAASLVAGGLIHTLPPGLFDPVETLPTAILKGYPVAEGAYHVAVFVAAALTLVFVAGLAFSASCLRAPRSGWDA